MRERSISDDSIYWVIRDPDTTKGNSQGTSPVKFIRTLAGRNYHVVAQWKKQEQAWLIVSVWVRGEADRESLSIQLILAPFRLLRWLLQLLFKKS
jgi:hypothetical protein